ILAISIILSRSLFAPSSSLFPYTTLFRSLVFLVISCPCALVISIPLGYFGGIGLASKNGILFKGGNYLDVMTKISTVVMDKTGRSEEHTSELQSRFDLVCRLLLEKKKSTI